ncbi:MAG: dienelactone hydrolase family protein [Deltaproteobacteria bacterium]|nr:dienelactone hydrolase family protein [Deltaproteobacteria bacterium]
MTVETRDVTFETPSGPRVGYLALPPSPRGAIVLAHEIFGRAPEIERAAVRLANAGYAALMPDLFGARFKPLCIRQAMGELTRGRGEFLDVLRAAGDEVATHAKLPRERVAVIGFCMGAGLALAVGNAFRAVSANYGDVPPTEVLRGIGPTIACFGGRDRVFAGTGELLRKRLEPLGVTPEIHTFPHAGHAFLCDGDHPVASFFTGPMLNVDPVRDAGDREKGWEKILAFLGTHAGA